MTVKYQISIVESERGWGQEYWTETYDTYEEAENRIREINRKNTSLTAPNWYMQAEDTIEAIEVK
jgi:hypothetical protein